MGFLFLLLLVVVAYLLLSPIFGRIGVLERRLALLTVDDQTIEALRGTLKRLGASWRARLRDDRIARVRRIGCRAGLHRPRDRTHRAAPLHPNAFNTGCDSSRWQLDALPVAVLHDVGRWLLTAGSTRDQEIDADAQGSRMAIQAGYDSHAAAAVLAHVSCRTPTRPDRDAPGRRCTK